MKPRSDLRWLALLVLLAGLLAGLGPLPAPGKAEEKGLTFFDEDVWQSIGGSLSTQPLSHAIYRYWTGEDEAGAARVIRHDWSDAPYQDLSILATRQKVQRGEEVPLYFAPEPYGEEQTREELEEFYEFVPIAWDALVFFTSAENPVTGVSGQALARVYAGDIANWRDLGGKDSPIRAFQRPWSSYAQRMLENRLTPGGSVTRNSLPWLLSLLDSLGPYQVSAPYDHSPSALGYTLYTYTRGMYGGGETRILAMDGVLPSQGTIAAGSYPLTTPYYAVFPKAADREHPVRALVAWLLTGEGQRVIRDAGLIPLTSLGEEEMVWPQPYPARDTRESRGTGGDRDRNAEARAYGEQSVRGSGDAAYSLWEQFYWERLWLDLPEAPELEERLREWQGDAREALRQEFSILKGRTQTVEQHVFLYGNLVSLHFSIGSGTDTRIRTAVFDMKTGKRLRLSDLFLDGVNYIDYINRFLLQSGYGKPKPVLGDFSVEERNLKRPFSGLPADYPYFVVSQEGTLCLSFQGMNPFFQVPSGDTFFAEIPLWHDVSPWGGCKVEESYTRIDDPARETCCDLLSLRIDEGQWPRAEKAVNERLEGFARRFAEMAETQDMPHEPGDFVSCSPSCVRYGKFYGVVQQAGEVFVPYSPVIGGFIVDLHTGEEALTPEQAKSLAAVPGAIFLRKEGGAPLGEEMRRIPAYSPPEDSVVHSCWLAGYGDEVSVEVGILEADGAWVTITVPAEAVAFWDQYR